MAWPIYNEYIKDGLIKKDEGKKAFCEVLKDKKYKENKDVFSELWEELFGKKIR